MTTTERSIDWNTRLAFSVVENPGVYALLLGSGISRAAEIPTGWDITLDLVRRVAVAEGVTDRPDWAAWYREHFGGEPSYSILLDALSMTAAERRSVLHRFIEPTAEDLEAGRRVPTRAHHAIARMVRDGFIRVIVTTNFDRLLENALSAVGVEPVVVKSVDDLGGASPLPHSRCFVLKVHGDYLDNRILNTENELAGYPPEYDRLLDRILDEYGLIVAGWSGDWDPALRAAIARAPNRRYPLWWATRGDPSAAAGELVANRAGSVVRIADADAFFARLADSVDVLSRSRRPAPETVELLVATAKRNLARPEHRIDLADLVAEQTDRTVRRIGGAEFPVDAGPATNAGLAERWAALEGVSEPLARIAGVAGRWGDGSEFGLFQDAVRAIVMGRPSTGTSAYIGVAAYPAYLTFLTYALGMTRAERWADLHRWLTMEITRPYGKPERAVDTLFMSFWEDVEPDWWKSWPGLERRITPWADHLVDAVVPWSRDFGLGGDAAVENYHTLELLGGVAAMGKHDASYLNDLQSFTWMPFGQSIRMGTVRSRILERLQDPDIQPALFQAGFARGSTEHWAGVLNNMELLSRKVAW